MSQLLFIFKNKRWLSYYAGCADALTITGSLCSFKLWSSNLTDWEFGIFINSFRENDPLGSRTSSLTPSKNQTVSWTVTFTANTAFRKLCETSEERGSVLLTDELCKKWKQFVIAFVFSLLHYNVLKYCSPAYDTDLSWIDNSQALSFWMCMVDKVYETIDILHNHSEIWQLLILSNNFWYELWFTFKYDLSFFCIKKQIWMLEAEIKKKTCQML